MAFGTWSADMDKTGWFAPLSSEDSAGDPTYGTPVAITYRHEKRQVVVRDSQGVSYDTRDMIITHDAIAEGGRIWLQGADKSVVAEGKPVATVEQTSDLDGLDTLYEVTL